MMIESNFFQQVNDAFKQCGSRLALSRSPLARTSAVHATLVVDDLSPTPEDLGRGLHIALRWAVERLAPATPVYPIGQVRPLDDPTWRDPLWWRYNILRHRYLEPLHPDEFVEGGRFTETLLALTGIPSADAFYDERNRAIREAAESLQRAAVTGYADADLHRMALQEITQPLATRPQARTLLEIASIFQGTFSRLALGHLARAEGIATIDTDLRFLLKHRFLLVGDQGDHIWMSEKLRAHIYQEQKPSERRLRHERAAAYYERQEMTLIAAHHLQQAAHWSRAADQLLRHREQLREEMQGQELRRLLALFPAEKLDAETWYAIQLLRCDVCASSGETDTAIESCRAALRRVGDPVAQARLYRRLGKLYEQRNQAHALNYYAQAEERLPPGSPELLTLLKDRGWLYVLRREWSAAKTDIDRGLALVDQENRATRADLLDALAGLYRNRGEYDLAVCHAQQALALREELGDLLRVAKSLGNLGLMYGNVGDYEHAIAAHREALAVYRQMGNHELWATALLNIGLAQHMSGERMAATQSYQESLRLCRQINLPLAEVRVLANLAEVLAELKQTDDARHAWNQGIELARLHAFDDEVEYYAELRARFPTLGDTEREDVPLDPPEETHATGILAVDLAEGPPTTDTREAVIALDLAAREGKITARRFMEAAAISKATATRRLAELAELGTLVRVGRGRGTSYVLAAREAKHPKSALTATQIARLQTLRPELVARHAVSSLGVVNDDRRIGHPVFMVRFTTLPDLLTFFQLEQRLSAALGQAVDLIPEACLSEQQRGERWQSIQLIW